MNRGALERGLTRELTIAGFEQPGYEARQILLEIFGVDASYLMLTEETIVSKEDLTKAHDWAMQRILGVPLAYLTNKKGFYKSEFIVKPGLLVPRPESELVVEVALNRIIKQQRSPSVEIADLGCGTGCIGLSLILELPSANLSAVDQSKLAAEVTLENATKLGVFNRVQAVISDVLKWNPKGKLNLIVANPPYIAVGDSDVQPSVHKYEPHEALYSGKDGLDAIRLWSEWAYRHLNPSGIFVCEIGASQKLAAEDIIKKLGFQEIQVKMDLSGKDRVISALKAR